MDMPNKQILTTSGHSFGHQSGLDESSGRDSTMFLYGIAFHVYLMFSKKSTNTRCSQIFTKELTFCEKGMLLKNIEKRKRLRPA